MPHFFINSKDVNNGHIIINDEDNYNHIAKSLRARQGEKLLLIDENKIQYETVIEQITKREITAKIENSYKSNRILDFGLYLAQSPLRSDSQSVIIEKATELGAAAVYPVFTDNCSVSKSVIEKKIAKWQRIMYEASKQCERADVPVCEYLTTLEALITPHPSFGHPQHKAYRVTRFDQLSGSLCIPQGTRENLAFDKVIAFCERRTTRTLHEFWKENPVKKGENLLVIIGPEGGFSDREFEFFEQNSIPMLTLGDLILKADTAVTVALGNIIYEYSNQN